LGSKSISSNSRGDGQSYNRLPTQLLSTIGLAANEETAFLAESSLMREQELRIYKPVWVKDLWRHSSIAF